MTFLLADLEQALLALAVQGLTDAGRPVPDPTNVSRYHGEPPVECCPDPGGALFVFWQIAKPELLGIPQGVGKPPGRPKVDLYLRLFRCFPTLGDRGEAPVGLDAAAAGLADDLDCLWMALSDAICDGSLDAYLSGCDQLTLIEARPRAAKGGCAGVELHLTAGWRPFG
jgi:hypothetical protein